jgi:large subunit ribosomal protein L23
MSIEKSRFVSLIHKPILTSKATELIEKYNVYSFLVDKSATKLQINRAIQEIFDVKPISVNTATLPKKSRRVGKTIGSLPRNKKAFIKLGEADSISFLGEE